MYNAIAVSACQVFKNFAFILVVEGDGNNFKESDFKDFRRKEEKRNFVIHKKMISVRPEEMYVR